MHRFSAALTLLVLATPAVSAELDGSSDLDRAYAALFQSGAQRVGEEVELSLGETTPAFARQGRAAVETALVSTRTIHHPGASYVAAHFSRMELAPGDSVIVRAPDYSRVWRYTGYGKGTYGLGPEAEGFWAVHIPGETVIIEFWSNGAGESFGYSIDKYARGYDAWETAEQGGPATESLCQADDTDEAKCYATSEPLIYDNARAVARLLINGSLACTGWLIGSEGHVMTNNHCIGTEGAAANTDFEFMAEGVDCATSCASWFACSGTVAATSSTLVQTDAGLDYTLVLPASDVSATYGYLQLRPEGATLEERIYVPQHPAAWGKRIAVESSYPENPSGFCELDSLFEQGCTGPIPDVGYFLDTQGGSSGSPVLGYSDHSVVALHHCRGNAFCTSGEAGDDPNRGVRVEMLIADLCDLLPADALSGDALILCSPTPGTAPAQNSWEVRGATPDSTAYLVVGFQTGSTNVPGCPGLSLDLQMVAFRSAATDSSGNATISTAAPASIQGKTVLFQAVDLDACTASTLTAHRF